MSRPRHLTNAGLAALAAALGAGLGGCAITPVQAWEKGHLARPEMGFGDRAAEARFDEHIYTSKEGAAGGSAVGGGGCGCN